MSATKLRQTDQLILDVPQKELHEVILQRLVFSAARYAGGGVDDLWERYTRLPVVINGVTHECVDVKIQLNDASEPQTIIAWLKTSINASDLWSGRQWIIFGLERDNVEENYQWHVSPLVVLEDDERDALDPYEYAGKALSEQLALVGL